jgi:hypothetical protein
LEKTLPAPETLNSKAGLFLQYFPENQRSKTLPEMAEAENFNKSPQAKKWWLAPNHASIFPKVLSRSYFLPSQFFAPPLAGWLRNIIQKLEQQGSQVIVFGFQGKNFRFKLFDIGRNYHF